MASEPRYPRPEPWSLPLGVLCECGRPIELTRFQENLGKYPAWYRKLWDPSRLFFRRNLSRSHSTTAQAPCVVPASRARTSPRVSVSRLMSIAGVGLTTFTAGERPASYLFIRRQKPSEPQPYANPRSLSIPLTPLPSVPNRRPLAYHQGPTRPVHLIRGRKRSLAGTSRELSETHRRPKILVISSLPRGEPTPELPSSQYPPRRIIGHAIGH